MDKKILLLGLIKARSGEKVKHIIDNHPLLSKDKNWEPYGGYHGNFNTIHNQQKNPVAVLAEKPTNSIDVYKGRIRKLSKRKAK